MEWLMLALLILSNAIWGYLWYRQRAYLKRFNRDYGTVISSLLSNPVIAEELGFERWPERFEEDYYWAVLSHLIRLESFYGYQLKMDPNLLELRRSFFQTLRGVR